MFALALLIGIYSYLIFALGLLGILSGLPILLITIVFVILSIVTFPPQLKNLQLRISNKKIRHLLVLFSSLAFVNLIGALGPELAFDALWYHLTLPKIFLGRHSIDFISGGLFYYSAMPKLGEMLFIPGLMFGNEILPKLIQWAFGILTSVVIYKVSRKFLDEKLSIIAVLIFYGNLVVAWQSTVAHIDLIRTFFEVMALWGFINWYEAKNKKWLVESAVMIGLAISTKLIALGTIPIFITLLLIFDKNWKKAIGNSLIFVAVSILVSFPWFVFAFINTGNPFFPVFSNMYPVGLSWDLLNPINILRDLFNLFLRNDDPISPIYIIFLPLLILIYKRLNKQVRVVVLYSLLSLAVWYFTPRTGGGRFILPYLPAFSILAASVMANINISWFKKYLVGLIIVVFITTIAYRLLANIKFVPVILGLQTKQEFLTKNLNFDFGDFYDTDGFFAKNIKEGKVLLYGFHNLYYANFPFIHETYVKKGDRFNYIATQKNELPLRFKHWTKVYENRLTNVKVYSLGGMMWIY